MGEEQRPPTGLDRTERSGQSAILDEGSEDYRVALRLDRRDAVLPFVARRPAPLAEITVEFERLERQRLDLAQPVALFHCREDVGPISESPPCVRLRTVLRERLGCDIFGKPNGRVCRCCNRYIEIRSDGAVMRGLTKINGNGEHQARVSDELRQLKKMSKGLRTQAMRALLERHAAQRRAAAVLPEKTRTA